MSYPIYNNSKNVLNHNPKYWQIMVFYSRRINGGINGAIDVGNNAASCVWQGVISQTLHSSQTMVWKKIGNVEELNGFRRIFNQYRMIQVRFID